MSSWSASIKWKAFIVYEYFLPGSAKQGNREKIRSQIDIFPHTTQISVAIARPFALKPSALSAQQFEKNNLNLKISHYQFVNRIFLDHSPPPSLPPSLPPPLKLTEYPAKIRIVDSWNLSESSCKNPVPLLPTLLHTFTISHPSTLEYRNKKLRRGINTPFRFHKYFVETIPASELNFIWKISSLLFIAKKPMLCVYWESGRSSWSVASYWSRFTTAADHLTSLRSSLKLGYLPSQSAHSHPSKKSLGYGGLRQKRWGWIVDKWPGHSGIHLDER